MLKAILGKQLSYYLIKIRVFNTNLWGSKDLFSLLLVAQRCKVRFVLRGLIILTLLLFIEKFWTQKLLDLSGVCGLWQNICTSIWVAVLIINAVWCPLFWHERMISYFGVLLLSAICDSVKLGCRLILSLSKYGRIKYPWSVWMSQFVVASCYWLLFIIPLYIHLVPHIIVIHIVASVRLLMWYDHCTNLNKRITPIIARLLGCCILSASLISR